MDRTTKLWVAAGASALLVLAACGDDDGAAIPPPPASPDAGSLPRDAGSPPDAGIPPDVGPATPPADSGPDLVPDTVDESLFEVVSEIVATFESQAMDVWSDSSGTVYRFDEIPLYLVRRDGDGEPNVRGYLIHHPSPPEGAITLSGTPENLGPVLRYDGALDAFGQEYFDFTLDVNGVPTLAFQYAGPEDDFATPTSPEFPMYLVHEGFHRHQIVEGAWTEPTSWFAIDPMRYPMDESSVAMTLLEDAVLREAILDPTPSVEEAESALRTFVAVRETRRALEPSTVDGVNVADYDDAGENVEGTALYTELTFVAVAGGRPFDSETVGHYIGLTAELLESRQWAIEHLTQGRTYGTGASIAHLLDLAGTSWRASMPDGLGPYGVARAHFAPDSPEVQRTLFVAAQATHAYDTGLLPQARAIAALE